GPVSMPFGVGTALYLELYMKKGKLQSIIQTNIMNLAGVPSIVYGILGLTIFVRALGLGNIVLAGGLTMSLLVLPIIVAVSQEAIRAVPYHLSEASYGLGATKWQTIRRIVLPAALPGILTGTILALSRAIGETAPLVVIGIPALLMPFPGGLFDKFTVLPMQIYYWTLDSTLVAEYANLAAATIIVLLLVLFLLNATAIIVRNKFQKRNDAVQQGNVYAFKQTAEENELIYQTRNLNLWYGKEQALKNINMSIHDKEVTAIIGPSGCGKSTYLKALNRMVELIPSVRME